MSKRFTMQVSPAFARNVTMAEYSATENRINEYDCGTPHRLQDDRQMIDEAPVHHHRCVNR